MTSADRNAEKKRREFDFLCVDDFIGDILSARALTTALEIGLVDWLLQNQPASFRSLAGGGDWKSRGLELLIALLVRNRVLHDNGGELSLSNDFLQALQFRDLLELRATMAGLAARDFLDHFSDLVCRPDRFRAKARFCRLFAYDRCFHESEENYHLTRQWMHITTTLTRYEAAVCMKYHDFRPYRRILDVGGNSGEFALQICRSYPQVVATVFDLPLVCDLGEEHIRYEPERARITFLRGNALTDPFPRGFDLITFKSMLHDWPEREANRFIGKAALSLAPGGTLLIFERGPLEKGEADLSYATIPMLLFLHSFRSPQIYERRLRELGLQDIALTSIYLDTPFFMLTAKKKIQEDSR
jgi:SAM-dependent methyltransferase